MSNIKKLYPNDITNYETPVQTDVSLTNSDTDSRLFLSKSLDETDRITGNANYHDFFRGNFFITQSGFHNYHYNPNRHINKFHDTSSLISISQKHLDEGIVHDTFKLKDTFYSSSTGTVVNPTIRDDGYGNLYSTNAYVSQSANSSISSSENYVGNIWYDLGLAVITETGSWSGSVTYQNLFKNNYDVNFKAQHTIYSTEYSITIEPEEFTITPNPSSRTYPSGSNWSGSFTRSPYLLNDLTSSVLQGHGFTHFTTVALYANDNKNNPMIIARLPKAIKCHNKVPITIKLKLDKTII